MAVRVAGSIAREDSELWKLLRAIASGDTPRMSRLLRASPRLASDATAVGATRQSATSYFFEEIQHYVYAGDTPLHVAAAAYRTDVARDLVRRGADVNARNRRGAESLHYACEGHPATASWAPRAQAAVIEYLLRTGADPNAIDKGGVTPLHRAVRTRCASAVRVLLAHGADPLRQNGNGSTALDLAVRTTGRGGSGSVAAREQQRLILQLLASHGADGQK